MFGRGVFLGGDPHDRASGQVQAEAVPSDPCVRLVLEVVLGAEPVRGVVRDGEWECGFYGWLELAAALEAALERGETGSAPSV